MRSAELVSKWCVRINSPPVRAAAAFIRRRAKNPKEIVEPWLGENRIQKISLTGQEMEGSFDQSFMVRTQAQPFLKK